MVPELWRTRYIRLEEKPAWSNRKGARFADLKDRNLKTHRAFRYQGDVTRDPLQRSERGAGRTAPRQVVQLGAPLPPCPSWRASWPSCRLFRSSLSRVFPLGSSHVAMICYPHQTWESLYQAVVLFEEARRPP